MGEWREESDQDLETAAELDSHQDIEGVVVETAFELVLGLRYLLVDHCERTCSPCVPETHRSVASDVQVAAEVFPRRATTLSS